MRLWIAATTMLVGVSQWALAAEPAADAKPEILSVEKIWDGAPHNAFVDLIRFKGKFYCTFREGIRHIEGDGTARVLESADGKTWTSVANLEEKGIDLRDPKISVMPDGRMMMVLGGSDYGGTNTKESKQKIRRALQPRVSFSTDGHTWTPLQKILREGQWLWRVTWNDGKAYGVVTDVNLRDPKGPEYDKGTPIELITSTDGIHWDVVTKLEVPDRPHEATVRFFPDGEMMALVRRNVNKLPAYIGTSKPPYKDWTWHETKHFVGGPNFLILPDGQIWGGGRYYPDTTYKNAKTMLARMTRESYDPVVALPSKGDNSYPGFVYHDGILWVAYYSKDENDQACIYLAKVKLPNLGQ